MHFLGNKSIDELPAYVQHMDVCTMFYEVNDYTKYIYPLKLHEYLAAGVPVVSSRIESLCQFGDVVNIASDDSSGLCWLAVLYRRNSAVQRPSQRAARSREYDWERLASRVADIIKVGVDRVVARGAK